MNFSESVESIELDAAILKTTALSVLEQNQKLNVTLVTHSLEEVMPFVRELTIGVQASASKGNLRCTYKMNELPKTLMNQVATEFRKIAKGSIQIIADVGNNQIVVDWSGNTEC